MGLSRDLEKSSPISLLTPEQLFEVQKIIERYHTAFIVNAIDPDAVPAAVLKELKQLHLVDPKIESIKDAYLYGQILAALQNPAVAKMTLDQLKSYLIKNPVPLTPIEHHAVAMASQQAAQYCRGLGNRVNLDTGQVLIEADKKLRAKLEATIRDATKQNIVRREGVQKLRSDLGWKTKDWARDLSRIALTEKQNAMQTGVAEHYKKKYGKDVLVARRAMPDACAHCKRLHEGPDGAPRIFRLADLEANGSNVGRKAAEWLPVVGVVHPHCQCMTVRVPNGWGFDEEGKLVPGGEFGQLYSSPDDLELALQEEADLQKALEAKRSITFQGFPIVIENSAGTFRRWTDAEGNSGETLMLVGYGYFEGTGGADGDEIDVFVGSDPRAELAFIVEQKNPNTDLYDEVKVLLGFSNATEAERIYRLHYNIPDEFFLTISPMALDALERWLAYTRPSWDPKPKFLEKSDQPLLVIPLVKAQVDATIGAATSQAGNRNPSMSAGVGANYLFPPPLKRTPKQPTPMLEDLKQPLDQPYTPDPLKRDPEDYLFRENVNPEPRLVIVPDSWEEAAEEAREGSEERKADLLDRNRRRSLASISNAPIEKSNVIELGPRGGHIVGHDSHGNPIYEGQVQPGKLIEEVGGKLTDDTQNAHNVVLKVPLAAKKKLEEWRDGHKLAGSIQLGSKYALFSFSRALISQVAHESDFASAEISPAQGMQPTIQNLQIPKANPKFLLRGQAVAFGGGKALVRGQMVSVKAGQGKIVGYSQVNNPMVEISGIKGVHEMTWSQLQPSGEKLVYKSLAENLPKGRVYKPTERQKKLLEEALGSVNVAGGHVASEFVGWLWDQGQETYLVGGAVRDLIEGTSSGSNANDEEIREKLKDIDVVSGAPPTVVYSCFKSIMKESFDFHYNSGGAPWGVLRLLFGGSGLDVATIVQSGSHSRDSYERTDFQKKLGTPKQKVAPEIVFDHDLQADSGRRDFTFNSIFYDSKNGVFIDPTGSGISDAQKKVLRLSARSREEALENEALGFRYLKFRSRGYKPTKETYDVAKERMDKTLTHSASKAIAQNIFKVYLKNDPKHENIEKALKDFQEGMAGEGWSDLVMKLKSRLGALREYLTEMIDGDIKARAEFAAKEALYQQSKGAKK